MGQIFEAVAGQLGIPLWLLLIALFWSLTWKAFALWRSARNRHAVWFVVLLLVHTMGILEILYLFLFSKIMENSADYAAVHSNSPDRKFGTKSNSIIQIICNLGKTKNRKK